MSEPTRFPLGTKILLLVVGNLALLGLVFGIFVAIQFGEDFESFLLVTARERIRLLLLELQVVEPSQRDELLARYSDAYGPTFLLWGEQGRIAGPDIPVPPRVLRRLDFVRGEAAPSFDRRRRAFTPSRPFLVISGGPYRFWVGIRTVLRDRQTGRPERATVLLASRTLFGNRFFFQWEPWIATAAVALLASLLCWFPMVRGLSRSIRQMLRATSQIAEGHFDVQVDSHRSDELGSLGASINRMSQRLATFVHGQKRFLGDAAHELRTPLARMQVALGILERKCDEDTGRYVADLQEEVETMSRLTGELLAFAKAEARPETLQLKAVDVEAAVREVVRVEGQGHNIRIEVEPALTVRANPEYLSRSLANLLRNAIRYAGDAGPVAISAERQGDEVVIAVADQGPGVPEEALEKIFTPFYRLEASRDRRTGGTGLGLAIARSSVEACGGSIEALHRTPSGLEVRLKLPAAGPDPSPSPPA